MPVMMLADLFSLFLPSLPLFSLTPHPCIKFNQVPRKKIHSVIQKLKSMVRFTAQRIVANLGFLRERTEIIKELPSFVETQAISSLNAAESFKASIAYLLN